MMARGSSAARADPMGCSMKVVVMRRLVVVWVALVVLGWSVSASAQMIEPYQGPETGLLRGDAYYYEGDYYRALTAYKDFLREAPDDRRAERVRLKMAWVYFNVGEHGEAARELDRLAAQAEDVIVGWWARYYYGQVALASDRRPLAERAFEEVITTCEPYVARVGEPTDDPEIRECLELSSAATLGLARLEAVRHDFDAASRRLRAMPGVSPLAGDAAEIADLVEGLEIPRKSPALAGILSIVPGLGHVYLGQYGSAFVAFLWNGAFIYAIVDSVLAGRYGQAVLIGLVESIWYGGTIFGAVGGAHRFNRDAMRVVEDGLRRDLLELYRDEPWPARFPAHPAYLELSIPF
ncbi:tetratricopeptide repeat protein [Lujinxingia vulgaris]|uniref:Tetratricopeptide repeat protein n=2 Tax=Lujinxingia vulgaris TaxID=2600176 RepID=A0A5C6WZW3_9DELT|nr:tetratricopeptide repeat protein [Lujinxingia vulgaris]